MQKEFGLFRSSILICVILHSLAKILSKQCLKIPRLMTNKTTVKKFKQKSEILNRYIIDQE